MKLAPLAPIPAYEDMVRLLRMLAEPELRLAELAKLEALRVEVNGLIRDKARISKLDALERQAAMDRSAAAGMVERARHDSDALVEAAKADASRVRAEARAAAESTKATLATEATVLQGRASEQLSRGAALDAREGALAAREAALESRMRELADAQAAHATQAARLKAALG